MKIVKCPICQSETNHNNSFLDWSETKFTRCENCFSYFQSEKKTTNYINTDWKNIRDPDGNIRDMTKERDFKIKNWYGDTVQYINNLNPGRVLDIGAGLGFFLSSLSNKWDKYAIEPSDFGKQYIKKNYNDISILASSIYDKEIKDSYFDVIMFYHVIEHLEKSFKCS